MSLAKRFRAPGFKKKWWTGLRLGLPPDTGHLTVGNWGVAMFRSGPQRQTVEQHPDYLQWMIMALSTTVHGCIASRTRCGSGLPDGFVRAPQAGAAAARSQRTR